MLINVTNGKVIHNGIAVRCEVLIIVIFCNFNKSYVLCKTNLIVAIGVKYFNYVVLFFVLNLLVS